MRPTPISPRPPNSHAADVPAPAPCVAAREHAAAGHGCQPAKELPSSSPVYDHLQLRHRLPWRWVIRRHDETLTVRGSVMRSGRPGHEIREGRDCARCAGAQYRVRLHWHLHQRALGRGSADVIDFWLLRIFGRTNRGRGERANIKNDVERDSDVKNSLVERNPMRLWD